MQLTDPIIRAVSARADGSPVYILGISRRSFEELVGRSTTMSIEGSNAEIMITLRKRRRRHPECVAASDRVRHQD